MVINGLKKCALRSLNVSMIVNHVSSVREKHLNLSEVDLFFAAMSVKFYTFELICLV